MTVIVNRYPRTDTPPRSNTPTNTSRLSTAVSTIQQLSNAPANTTDIPGLGERLLDVGSTDTPVARNTSMPFLAIPPSLRTEEEGKRLSIAPQRQEDIDRQMAIFERVRPTRVKKLSPPKKVTFALPPAVNRADFLEAHNKQAAERNAIAEQQGSLQQRLASAMIGLTIPKK